MQRCQALLSTAIMKYTLAVDFSGLLNAKKPMLIKTKYNCQTILKWSISFLQLFLDF